jgi:hypothetical protein
MNTILKTAMLGAVLIASSAPADDVSGSKRILCSIQDVNVCESDASCTAALAAELNIPQFIEIDTKTGMLATTAASGESRETAASQVSRSDDHLLIHGDQSGRVYSLLIQESTGQASFASVADGDAVIIFAACTPISD